LTDAQLILVAGTLTVAGLLASLLADRLKVPGLVLFLGLGMAIGSDGVGWIDFSDYELARTIGVVGLALILFEGGLSASWSEIRPVLPSALSLALAGTLITAAIAGLAATWLFDLSLLEGMLLGSIVAATDGAAIFSVLRGSRLRRRLSRTLEGEAGFNDPVAVLLVVGLIDWIQSPGYGVADMTLLFLKELGIGLAVGLAVGWLAVQGLRRIRLGTEAGYVIGTLGVAALAYGAASSLDGSGFLAVYLTGLTLGSWAIPAQRAVTVFHQGLASLAQVAMFLVLGLLVFPGELAAVAPEGTVLALVLMLVARPVATFAATAAGGLELRERTVLAWAGLRGAVPVVLATFPVIEGVHRSVEFFNIVFFAVLLSTLVQGASFEAVARRLGVLVRDTVQTGRGASARRAGSIAQISVTRPWSDDDGDAAFPKQVGGIPVVEQLATRIDQPAALVALADGRYAVTGRSVAIGSASALQRGARRELARATSAPDRAWWREVIGELAR
jgi:cell volume regulation protein A